MIMTDKKKNELNSLQTYFNGVNSVERLDAEQEYNLLKKAANGDLQARNDIVSANLRLAISIAKKYCGRGLPFDDLIQESTLGLFHAIDKFDVQRGLRFSTYAFQWCNMYCSRAIANKTRTVRLPVHMIQVINKVRHAQQEAETAIGRTYTAEQLAEHMPGYSLSELKEAMSLLNNPICSLDTPVGEQGDEVFGDSIPDNKMQTPMSGVFKSERSQAIAAVLATLSPRQSAAVSMRMGLYGPPCTLDEIGQYLNVTRQRALQIFDRAMDKLRNPVRADRLRDFIEEEVYD